MTNDTEAQKGNVKVADLKGIQETTLNSLHALSEDTVKITDLKEIQETKLHALPENNVKVVDLKGVQETKLHALPEDTVKVADFKAIQETKFHAHPEDKGTSVIVKQKVDKPLQVTEIKLLAQPGEIQSTFNKAVPVKKNKLKFKKRRPKWVKMENGNPKKKKRLTKKQLVQKQLRKKKAKKQLFNRKKQLSRKMRNKTKKQARNLNTDKLHEIINLIHSLQKGNGSKLSEKYIKEQIVNLLNGHYLDKLAGKSAKGCSKPKSKKRKTRKLLRNTSKTKPSKARPNKKSVILEGTQEISKAKDTGHEKEVRNVIKAILKNARGQIKANKGKVKSKINVQIERKDETLKTTEK